MNNSENTFSLDIGPFFTHIKLSHQTVRNEHNGFVANTRAALCQCYRYADENLKHKPDQFRDNFKPLADELRLATENKD
ncbi:hypothetical protein T265_08135 [Opisthorchis viverrini]|nr:hypothetical protein T265_08135 [Opisthorchis viverrini]KER24151.1 hypothetical protein T265_08135 [Opisthorchis viverrini]